MTFEEAIKQINELNEFLHNTALNAISEFFSQYKPRITSISIDAYRDHFCDGDPCSYYLRESSLTLNGYNIEEEIENLGLSEKEIYEIRDGILDFLYKIPVNVLESICPDGTIHWDGSGITIGEAYHN